MKADIKYDELLNKSINIARVIDDGASRDKALSCIAQIQAAIDCPNDALETISLIRYDDIRADAVRKSLDNLIMRYSSNNQSLPQLDFWLDKLMEDTMAIPEPEIRCPKLHIINLLILSRLEDKEKAISILKMIRREFSRLDNVRKRSKYLFAVYQMFQQMNEQAEAVSTLKSILKRISEYRPTIEQGVMLGMVAHEYWKMNDQQLANECILLADSAKAMSYAYLQLIQLLAFDGKIDDALSFIDLLENEKHKNIGNRFIEIGKFITSHVSILSGAIISINKSRLFRKSSKNSSPDFLFNSESESSQRPVCFGFSVAITPKNNEHMENDAKSDKQTDENSVDDPDSVNDSNSEGDNHDTYDWDKFDWDKFDGDAIKENHEELKNLWNENDDDDYEEDDSDDDDDYDELIDSDEDDSDEDENFDSDEDEDDEDEIFNSDDDDDDNDDNDENDFIKSDFDDLIFDNDDDDEEINSEDEDEEDSSDVAQQLRKLLDIFTSSFTGNHKSGFSPQKMEFLQKFFRKQLASINDSSDVDVNRFLNERFFCITESIPGAVSFNRTLPSSLFLFFLRRLTQFFSVLNIVFDFENESFENAKTDFLNRQLQIGFEAALQEVISQGNYKFAVDCAINHFLSLNTDQLVVGYENLFINKRLKPSNQ